MTQVSVCQEQSKESELEARTGSQPRCLVPDRDLQTILTKLVARYGTQTALAKAVGLTDSRLAKVLKGDAGALSVLNCLRLAKVSGVSPSQILRAAGKSEIVALIEDMYGTSARPAMEQTPERLWPDMSPKAQAALQTFLDEVGPPKRRKRSAR